MTLHTTTRTAQNWAAALAVNAVAFGAIVWAHGCTGRDPILYDLEPPRCADVTHHLNRWNDRVTCDSPRHAEVECNGAAPQHGHVVVCRCPENSP